MSERLPLLAATTTLGMEEDRERFFARDFGTDFRGCRGVRMSMRETQHRDGQGRGVKCKGKQPDRFWSRR
jgi:hypothetical protein